MIIIAAGNAGTRPDLEAPEDVLCLTKCDTARERCLTKCDTAAGNTCVMFNEVILLQVTLEWCLTRCDAAAGNAGAGPVAEEREDVLCLTRCDTAAGNTYV